MPVRSGRHGRLQGATVGGIFGAIWLIASANTPLGNGAAAVFRIIGIVGIVVLFSAQVRSGRHADTAPGQQRAQAGLFGRAYWQIVAGEIAVLAIGFAVFAPTGAPAEVYRPWTAIIVALHFIAFQRAGVWQGNPVWPAVPMLAVGIAGFALAYTVAAGWVSLVTGIGSGAILLGGALQVVARDVTDARASSGVLGWGVALVQVSVTAVAAAIEAAARRLVSRRFSRLRRARSGSGTSTEPWKTAPESRSSIRA